MADLDKVIFGPVVAVKIGFRNSFSHDIKPKLNTKSENILNIDFFIIVYFIF